MEKGRIQVKRLNAEWILLRQVQWSVYSHLYHSWLGISKPQGLGSRVPYGDVPEQQIMSGL
jgi:hypothetical protein